MFTNTCLTDHIIIDCPVTSECRFRFMSILENRYGALVPDIMRNLDRKTFVNTILGVPCPVLVDALQGEYDGFLGVLFKHCHLSWLKYKTL